MRTQKWEEKDPCPSLLWFPICFKMFTTPGWTSWWVRSRKRNGELWSWAWRDTSWGTGRSTCAKIHWIWKASPWTPSVWAMHTSDRVWPSSSTWIFGRSHHPSSQRKNHWCTTSGTLTKISPNRVTISPLLFLILFQPLRSSPRAHRHYIPAAPKKRANRATPKVPTKRRKSLSTSPKTSPPSLAIWTDEDKKPSRIEDGPKRSKKTRHSWRVITGRLGKLEPDVKIMWSHIKNLMG